MSEIEKPIEKHFADWESHVFGFGYGTGEEHTIAALKTFMENIGREEIDSPRAYDYQQLETALTPPVAWLLINILCKANIIEYGTSPRYGWLTKEGEALRDFVASKSVDDLYGFCMADDLDYCYPSYCNCQLCEDGHSKTDRCQNPFWVTIGGKP